MQSCWFGVLFFWLFLMAPAFAQEGATFVGAESCAGCHAPETERWKTSHHALAMQKASVTTILGDFANATLTHHGVTTVFSPTATSSSCGRRDRMARRTTMKSPTPSASFRSSNI